MDTRSDSATSLSAHPGRKPSRLRLKKLLKLVVNGHDAQSGVLQTPKMISVPTPFIPTSPFTTAFSTPRAAPPLPTPHLGSLPSLLPQTSTACPFQSSSALLVGAAVPSCPQLPVPLSIVNGRLNGLRDFGAVRLLGGVGRKDIAGVRQKGRNETAMGGLGIVGFKGPALPPPRFSSLRNPSFLRRLKSSASLPMQDSSSLFNNVFDTTSPFDASPAVPTIPDQYICPLTVIDVAPQSSRAVNSIRPKLSSSRPATLASELLPPVLSPSLPIDASLSSLKLRSHLARLEAYEKLVGVSRSLSSTAFPRRIPFASSSDSESDDDAREEAFSLDDRLQDEDSSDEEDESLITPQSSPQKTAVALPVIRLRSVSVVVDLDRIVEPEVLMGCVPSERKRMHRGAVPLTTGVNLRDDGFF